MSGKNNGYAQNIIRIIVLLLFNYIIVVLLFRSYWLPYCIFLLSLYYSLGLKFSKGEIYILQCKPHNVKPKNLWCLLSCWWRWISIFYIYFSWIVTASICEVLLLDTHFFQHMRYLLHMGMLPFSVYAIFMFYYMLGLWKLTNNIV